jgi:hypothetical protein
MMPLNPLPKPGREKAFSQEARNRENLLILLQM